MGAAVTYWLVHIPTNMTERVLYSPGKQMNIINNYYKLHKKEKQNRTNILNWALN